MIYRVATFPKETSEQLFYFSVKIIPGHSFSRKERGPVNNPGPHLQLSRCYFFLPFFPAGCLAARAFGRGAGFSSGSSGSASSPSSSPSDSSAT